MMIALFDPDHLPIDLSKNRRSALLGTHDGVMVQYWRSKLTVVVARLELDPNATIETVSSELAENSDRRTLDLLA